MTGEDEASVALGSAEAPLVWALGCTCPISGSIAAEADVSVDSITIDLDDLIIETGAIEYVFQPGSRVLVQIASASFPLFEAHANTDEYWADAVALPPARQTIHRAESAVTLPVVSELSPASSLSE